MPIDLPRRHGAAGAGAMRFICPHCRGTDDTVVRSYKHDWHSCNACGTVTRELRQSPPLDKSLFRFLVRRTKLRLFFAKTLLSRMTEVESNDDFYAEYAELARKGVKGTKWEKVNAGVVQNLARHGIRVDGASILDVSGGPGFLALDFKDKAKRVLVTEFSQRAVLGMTRELGIDAVKFDYNSDDLAAAVDGKWDIVTIIYSIGFCDDLRKFIQSLRHVLHEGSLVYVCYSPPTLGMMMRWQFDDYTYTRSWPVPVVTSYFKDIGMDLVATEDEGSVELFDSWFDTAHNPVARLLQQVHRAVARFYLRRVPAQAGPQLDLSLAQRNVRQIFRMSA